MCHGHPRHHPCSHTSINWHYCPAALVDMTTGVAAPCSHLSYATAQPSNLDCPLQNCKFKAMGGSWMCCQCHQGPNTLGWCTALIRRPIDDPITHLRLAPMQEAYKEEQCAHGCCEGCTHFAHPPGSSRSSSPDTTVSDHRREGVSRKFGHSRSSRSSHRRASALYLLRGFTPVGEEDPHTISEVPSTPTTSNSLYSSGSSAGASSVASSRYAFDLNYAAMRAGSPIGSTRKNKAGTSAGSGRREKSKHKVGAC